MGDLDKLIAAVEAGECPTLFDWDAGLPKMSALAAEAFSGSLDAALRLHEALLPGWAWTVGDNETTVWPPNELADESWCVDGISASAETMPPARAWLLAILRALQAQSTSPISPEEAQFNAVRHHERFGPLDEKGNPLDPRRRG